MNIVDGYDYDSDVLANITCAASLAHHGLLNSVKWLWLEDIDMTTVPAEHLASLVSRVTEHLVIENVHGCDLVTVLDSVKSKELLIKSRSLNSEETQALVRAIESGVERVRLIDKVKIDISAITSYNRLLDRCRGKLMTLARSRNWNVIQKKNSYCIIQKRR